VERAVEGGYVTEADLQRTVVDLAHAFGWRVAHFRPARTERGWRTPVEADGQGFVDLVIAPTRPGIGRTIFAELKAEKGKLSTDQEIWLRALELGGCEVHVWRPSDLDAIERRLRLSYRVG
jgi:VRR-NUC domain-containing protein